jgi:hypothetical protein
MMRKKEACVARGLKKRESGTEFLFFFKWLTLLLICQRKEKCLVNT